MKRRAMKGRIPVGALLHEPPAIRQPGQQVEQSARDASNESAKMGGERGLESRSMPYARGLEAAA
jgi:hypothetical protein